MHQYKAIRLGLFERCEDAVRARLEAEKELFGVNPRREAAFKEAGL